LTIVDDREEHDLLAEFRQPEGDWNRNSKKRVADKKRWFNIDGENVQDDAMRRYADRASDTYAVSPGGRTGSGTGRHAHRCQCPTGFPRGLRRLKRLSYAQRELLMRFMRTIVRRLFFVTDLLFGSH